MNIGRCLALLMITLEERSHCKGVANSFSVAWREHSFQGYVAVEKANTCLTYHKIRLKIDTSV